MKRFFPIIFLALATAGCPPADRVRVLDLLPPPLVPERPAAPVVPLPPETTPARRPIIGATIVVDPGHGGTDPGTLGGGKSRLPEKTIVLDVANQLACRLRECGARVVQTRKTDLFIELDDRAELADRVPADLFISVHADSAARSSASGVTLYIARGNSSESRQAACSIEAALRSAGIATRGVDHAGYRVLVGHSRPAVLVECGFLTNPGDARRLNSPQYRSHLAAVLAQGIVDYFAR